MTREELDALRHPSENSRFWLTMLVVGPVLVGAIMLVVASSGIMLFAVAMIILAVWVSTKLMAASFLGNFVHVSPENFPDIDNAVREYKALFGYKGQIDVYVTRVAISTRSLYRSCVANSS